MKLLPTTIAASLLLANANALFQPNQKMTWNIALGEKNFSVSKEDAEVVEIDFNSVDLIKSLHAAGKKVICYFSGGTLEKWRYDYDEYKKHDGLVREPYDGWEDELIVDYRKDSLKPLLKERMKRSKERGCDAIDVDNVDLYQVKKVKNWSNAITKDDAIAFTTWLGKTAHEVGIAIGLKNCLDIVDTVGKYYDFAISEHCVGRDECKWYKNYLQTGKPVFGITYGGLDSNKNALCRNLDGLPITMVIKNGDNKLEQASVRFDGNKYCGSSFKSGKVSPPETKKESTVTEKNVPTPVKTPVKTVANNSTATATGVNTNANTNANTNVTTENDADINTTIINGNNTVTETPKSDSVVIAPISSNDSETSENSEEKNEGGAGTIITGVAVTGSIVSAAALVVFLKKNPSKYESIKRGISKRATTVKRGASTVTRRLTSKN